ncbi:LysR family transcriptional regulator [Pigmentiphaga kullae]|uniref:LysR family transcriptional regulator n=1 Tax=Pigmentiphaga kullae TaxID=151784 RepID=A0A4Q7NJR1_9BURK|nr:LysR family transcriptional regulator [Pigmentiphaga kullae]RZS84740.1 LysR family transcriptional regulator [Pigmentiphaga kullae]
MQLHQLRAFVAVAEAGGISAAAKLLDVTQPAITRALQQLELSVGATLLTRSAHGIELTPYGQALLEHARLIVRAAADAHTHIRQLAGDLSGKLSIASSAAPFALVVPRAIETMRLRFPDVYIHLQEATYPTVMDLFREKGLDFAIGPLPAGGPGEGYRHDPLFTLDLVVAVRRGHPKARARSLRALADVPWLVTGPADGPGMVIRQSFVDAGLPPPQCVMHCESVGGAIQIIEHGNIASFVPRYLAEEARAAGRLAIVPVAEALPSLTISAFMPAQKILSPAGQALYSAIHSISRSLRPPGA